MEIRNFEELVCEILTEDHIQESKQKVHLEFEMMKLSFLSMEFRLRELSRWK
jgi:hypothetical protein